MATEFFYFRGTAKWAQLTTPDKDYDNFKINVYLDGPSKELFVKSGIQVEPKSDEDGEYVKFSRKNYQQINKDLVHFGAPKVIDTDGRPVTELIGNGSEVIVKVGVYDSRKGKGHRLDTVQVVKLIPYEGKGGQQASHAPAGVDANF